MINVIVNRTITKNTTQRMIGNITGLSSPRMKGEWETSTVTVELNVGSEEDIDKDTNDITLEVDELDDIKLMEVLLNDNNMLLVLEVISYELIRLMVSDVKGWL